MSDEQLRMRAVIDDGYSGPLAKLRNELRATGRSGAGTGRDMAKDWKSVQKSIEGVVGSMKLGLAPVMRGIGISSLGIGAAITGAIVGLRGFASSSRELGIFSRQIGISTDKLREMKLLGEHFGVSWESAQGNLKTFAGNLDELRRHWGEAYNQLRAMNLGGLAEDLAKAPDMATALDRALEGIKGIQNPVRRRQVAELLLGSDQWAVVAAETTPRIRNIIRGILKDMPKLDPAAAEDFATNMLKIEAALTKLRVEGFGPLLPEVNRLLDKLANPQGGWIIQFANDLAAGLKQVNDIIEAINEGKWSKIFNLMFKIRPGSAADAIFGGTSIGPTKGERLEYLQKKLDETNKSIEHNASHGDPSLYLKAQRDELIKEMEKLRKAIEDASKNGALLQQQSFTGGGFGGARILRTSLGGGSGGYGGGSGSGSPPGPMGGGGPLPEVPGGVIDRSRFAKELERNPALREKIMGIAAGENLNPKANISVLESMMNRAAMAGTSLAAQARLYHGEGGYYAGYNPGALRNPRIRAMIEHNLRAALAGSNVSNYATDNSSGGLAAGEKASGKFKLQSEYGGESFFSPGWGGGRSGPRSRSAYEAWRRSIAPGAAAGDPLLDRTVPLPRPAPPEIRGNATIDINFNGLPAGSRVRHQFDGLFREINIRRGHPMQSVWDA